MLHLADLHLRDPYLLPLAETRTYYLYGTPCYREPGSGLDAYTSQDLNEWEGPFEIFYPEPGFWADRDFWAPEVHAYRGQYALFVSFKAQARRRGTQILLADSPLGPFRPISDGPATPAEWECLDGTLFVDGTDHPWMVFCHEWVQIGNGTMCALPLSDDLTQAIASPQQLFSASEAPWVSKHPGQRDFITDGPCLHRTQDGTLLLVWSSFGDQGYAVGTARSISGQLSGPWVHDPEPLYRLDGGHGSIAHTFEGTLLLALHRPNHPPEERPVLLPVREEGGSLRLR